MLSSLITTILYCNDNFVTITVKLINDTGEIPNFIYRYQQHVSAAVVRPIHEVEGNPNVQPPTESMKLEISTRKIAQVIT